MFTKRFIFHIKTLRTKSAVRIQYIQLCESWIVVSAFDVK